MGLYWLPILLGALGIVLLLAVAVVCLAHVRRFLHTVQRERRRTEQAVVPLRNAAAELRTRR
jgi:membrane protein implicated in regulation of membrane protease activity